MSLTLKADDWFSPGARWIGPADWRDDACILHPHPFVFHTTLPASVGPTSVTMCIACTLVYAVYVNGNRVHTGPARSLPGEVYADRVELTLPASDATHDLQIIVFPSKSVSAYEVHHRIGLLAELRTGQQTLVATDHTWRVGVASTIHFHGLVCSLPTTWQEHWTQASLGTLENDLPARVLGSIGTPPWKQLLQRDCALLTHIFIDAPVVYSGVDSMEQAHPSENLAKAFNKRSLDRVNGDDTHTTEWLLLDQHRNVITVDVGRTRMVRPRVRVRGAAVGQRIEVYYDIGLVDRPTASLGFESPREGSADSLTLDTTACDWQPVATRGARYVTLRLAGAGACEVRFEIEASEYPCAQPEAINFGDVTLNEIYARSIPTLRSSTTDCIVDTCSRENMLWTADAALTGEAHVIAFGDATQWRRCLGLIARWNKTHGPWCGSVVPAGDSAMILTDQALQAIIALDAYAKRTGDIAFAREAVECFEPLIDACANHLTADDLFVPPDWVWHWIDWAPIDRRPYSMPINLLLLLASETIVKIVNDASVPIHKRATEIASRVRPALGQFWSAEHGCFRDHIEPTIHCPQTSLVMPMPSADFSAHANALAIRACVGGEEKQKQAAQWLADHLSTLAFGPCFTDIVLGTLIHHGHTAIAIAQLKLLYQPWINHNQPTWSEGFGQTNYNTAHGWGAVALLVLERLDA